MIKSNWKLEYNVNGKNCTIFFENGFNTDELKEITFQVNKYIAQVEDHAKAQEAEKNSCEDIKDPECKENNPCPSSE